MAGQQTYTIDIQTQGLGNIARLQTNIDNLQKRMMGLKTVIASGLFAGLGASALHMADDLQDLSNSTGIATARLVEFKKALSDNGGQIENMAQGVTTFVRSIDEAAQGSLKAQNTFRELGITMQDLQTMGEQELMVKALKSIGNIENASRRAAILMDLFGKSFRTVDAGALADDLEKSAGSGDRYAESIQRAAQLNDALAQAAGNVRLAFLEAFSPVIESLNKFNAATSEGTAKMDLLIAGLKIAGAVLVTAFSVGPLLLLVRAIGTIGRAFEFATGAAAAAAAAGTKFVSVFRPMGAVLTQLRAIAVLISAGLGIYAATQLFDDFGNIAVNALARISESILDMAGALLNTPTDAIAGLMNMFGAGIKDPKGLGTPFMMARDAIESMRKKQEESAQAQKKLKEETAKTTDASKEQADAVKRAMDRTQFDNAAAGVRKVGDGFREATNQVAAQLQSEIALIGQSREAVDLETQRIALSQRAADAVRQLQDAQATMSKELKEAGLGQVYDEQIARVQELARAEDARLTRLVSQLSEAQKLEQLRLFGIRAQQDEQDQLLKIQREMADLTLTDIEKSYRNITRAADDSARAAIRAEEARRGAPLNAQEVESYYQKARRGVEGVISAQRQLNDASRSFNTGWQKAWADFTDNAANAAQAATRLFDKFTSGIEDALVDFAKTGKFEWKNFVAGMAEELLRSQIKQTLASVLQISNPFSSSGSSIGDSLGGLFGGLLGGGGAARGQSANTPMYVYDVAGGGGAGGIMGGIMGPPQPTGGSGGGIMGTIGNIFSGVKDTVGRVFGGIGSAIGGVVDSVGSIFSSGGKSSKGGGLLNSIGSTIGDFFGGFFANGGNIPAGRFGLVGERGPEFIGGPATITPMGGGSNVTYNISAVDAASFQALVARDPQFIHAVAMAGSRGMPSTRR
jgi:lambda family phage tail tape measure protein